MVVNVADRPSYHHGALRAALLQDGRTLLEEVGPADFSLSELARRAGVSPSAVYRHFADKEALLDGIADEGYRVFHQALLQAQRQASDERDGLLRMVRAYLGFAREQPGLFSVMFRARPGRAESEAGPPAFATLVEQVAVAQRAGLLAAGQPAVLLARSVWALVHGAAVLAGAGGLSKLGLDAPLEDLAEELLFVLIQSQPPSAAATPTALPRTPP